MRTKQDRDIVTAEAKRLEGLDISNIDTAISFVKDIIEVHPFTYFSILTGRRFEKVWSLVLEKTRFLDEHFKPNSATRVYYFINKLDHIHRCETCNKPYIKQIRAGSDVPKYFHCDVFCAQQNPKVARQIKATKIEHKTTTRDLLDRTKQRNREKYGVDWYYQTKEFEEKKLATWKSHGYDHPMHSTAVKDGIRERYEQNHGKGIRWSFQDPEVIEKSRQSHVKNLGVDWPSQHPELKKTMVARSADGHMKAFYDNTIMHFETVKPLFDANGYMSISRSKLPLKWKCNICGNEFEQFMYQYGKEPRCLSCKPLLYNRSDSQEEIDLFNFLSSIDGSLYEPMRHGYYNWNLLDDGRLLDVVCISKATREPKIAIEFNGVYWHSVAIKDLGYHLSKTKMCEEKGIKLIHIWEDEWITDISNVKSFLEEVMTGKFTIPLDEKMLTLDRSKVCKLWVPDCYNIDETLPKQVERSTQEGKSYIVEDCGKLVLTRK